MKFPLILVMALMTCLGLLYSAPSLGKRVSKEPPAEVLAVITDPNAPHPGKVILESRCSLCHVPPNPEDYTLYEWPSILKNMGQKASLRPKEAQQLYEYIESVILTEEPSQSMSKDATKAN